ncbi:VTT domain-containing protein [Variovorax sp. PBL-E5]|uniref:VTT domain-containing protein n=1 Tax=Variovorax sp. PBL-E5 TaxID=434014 RepID=UPI0013191CAA|nr:VTT domain-containing protein [Variovorax sp. PBL-E5]VTU37902.1 Inner membrane protein YohD [Variovorax sp. PBL-E5]
MNDFISLLANQGALVVFAATLATRLGAPVPAVPFLIVAGGLSVGGQVSFAAVTGAAVIGNILGDGVWFLAGRRWGYRVMRLLCRISLSADTCVKRSESILGRWGGWSLIAAKFVPGVSVIAPPMAGALGMSNTRFLSYETVAALIWALGFLVIGRIFHAAIQDILAVLSEIGIAASIACGLALLVFVAWRWRVRRLALRADDIVHIGVLALREALAAGAGPTVIDVRAPQARALDPREIPGALAIDLNELPKRLGAFSDGRELVVFCDCPEDASAIVAARLLMAAGLPRVRVLAGGLDAWTAMVVAGESEEGPMSNMPAIAAHSA